MLPIFGGLLVVQEDGDGSVPHLTPTDSKDRHTRKRISALRADEGVPFPNSTLPKPSPQIQMRQPLHPHC